MLYGGLALGGAWLAGEAWTPLLAWTVWSADLLAYGSVTVAFGLAVVLGTPGCEYGAFVDAADRLRGRTRALLPSHTCAAGLHMIDAWEVRRARHRAA